jgi:hypothetical protein
MKTLLRLSLFILALSLTPFMAQAMDGPDKKPLATERCGFALSTGAATKEWDRLNRKERDWLLCSKNSDWDTMSDGEKENAEKVTSKRWDKLSPGARQDWIKSEETRSWSGEQRKSHGPFQNSVEDNSDYR